ncbi:MAG: hypothetical protein QXV17_14770 [Candidatus Micrarchaeaceae archaeon]
MTDEKDKEEDIGTEDQLILLKDAVNYAIEEINKLAKIANEQNKDIIHHYGKIIQIDSIDARLNGLESDIMVLRDNFYRTEADFKDIFRKQYLDIGEMKQQIHTLQKQNEGLRNLVNALYKTIDKILPVNIEDKKE